LCPESEKSDLKGKDVSVKCAYLVGDDTCSAVKEEEVSCLRAEACRNEIKDRCCYTCSYTEECNIRCDLLDNKNEKEEESSSDTQVSQSEVAPEAICGDCAFYLESKCPRGYINDLDLWRRQEGCNKFRSKQKKS
jgi:hypothetical protein